MRVTSELGLTEPSHAPAEQPLELIPSSSSDDRFAKEQIKYLVRQIFFPGWPKPCRQVAFSSVEDNREMPALCLRVGEELAACVRGAVAVVEADWRSSPLDIVHGRTAADVIPATPGLLRMFSRQISDRLWLVPLEVFAADNHPDLAADWLSGQLAQLRMDFDYSVLHVPAASLYSEVSLFGTLTDGLVLVLQANRTRRTVARETKRNLESANVRVLGTVLANRTFPVPQRIYDRL